MRMELEDVIQEMRILQTWLHETKFDHRSQVSWVQYELENLLLKYDKQVAREKYVEKLREQQSSIS